MFAVPPNILHVFAGKESCCLIPVCGKSLQSNPLSGIGVARTELSLRKHRKNLKKNLLVIAYEIGASIKEKNFLSEGEKFFPFRVPTPCFESDKLFPLRAAPVVKKQIFYVFLFLYCK